MMKCRIMRHFIRVCTVSFNKEIQFQLKIVTCDTSICTKNYPKFNVSNLKVESISDLGVLFIFAVKHPPAICYKVPGLGRFARVCLEIYNVDLRRKSMCTRLLGVVDLKVYTE